MLVKNSINLVFSQSRNTKMQPNCPPLLGMVWIVFVPRLYGRGTSPAAAALKQNSSFVLKWSTDIIFLYVSKLQHMQLFAYLSYLSKIEKKIKRYKKTDKQRYRHNYKSSKSNSEPTVVFLKCKYPLYLNWSFLFLFFKKKILSARDHLSTV